MNILRKLLFPCPIDQFRSEIWQQRCHHFDRKNSKYLAGFLSRDRFREIVCEQPISATECKVVKKSEAVSKMEFSEVNVGLGFRVVDIGKLEALFKAGNTIILDSLNNRDLKVRRITEAVVKELGCKASINAYLTPPHAQGFIAHYDLHDVIVLQIHGRKRWRIWDFAMRDPPRYGEANRGLVEATIASNPVLIDLRQGDCLYIPRGMVHEAESCEEDSLHLSLGVEPLTAGEVMERVIADILHHDVRFRRSAPLKGVDLASVDFAKYREMLIDELRAVDVSRAFAQMQRE